MTLDAGEIRCGQVPRVAGARHRVAARAAVLGLVLLGAASTRGEVRLSEFLALNHGGLRDQDGDTSDWIEIENTGAQGVSLEGWALTDDPQARRGWVFPAVGLEAGGFLLVFASGKDRRQSGGELHADFRLDGGGEYLALADPQGDLAGELSPAYPRQYPNVSYGLAPQGWRYFLASTPGRPNSGPGIVGFVADTRFSVDRGFYAGALAVEITTATPGAEIRFTTDGTPPAPDRGRVYTGPIPIAETTVLRAAAFKPEYAPGNPDTQTYLFVDDVVRQSHDSTLAAGFPPSWGGTTPDYGMDPDVIGQDGADRYGGKYTVRVRDGLLSIPTLSIVMDAEDLFGARGIYTNPTLRGLAWERPCSVELIHADASRGFQEDCGIRIHGGAFRSHGLTKKHSFRLVFKGTYGATKLRHPLFGPRAAASFDTLVLRACANDGWQWGAAGSQPLYIRDAFARATLLAMGGVAAHGIFVHLYLNGAYWGVYEVVERPDDSFSAAYFGGRKEEWDAISNGEAASGNLGAWNTLVDLAGQGLSDLAAYQRLQGNFPDGRDDPGSEDYFDADNYADYMVANLWLGNNDWPQKNYWCARRRGPGSDGFKFYLWDAEWSLLLRSDLGTNRTGVREGVAAPWPGLKESGEFRLLFADHVQRHFSPGGALHVDPQNPAWDPLHPERNAPAARLVDLAERVRAALVAESARWGDQHSATPYTVDEHWAVEIERVLAEYLPQRSGVVLEQFREAGLYPGVAAPFFSRPGGRVAPGFVLTLTAPGGRVYYTLDGPDPRLPGGAVAPEALAGGEGSRWLLLAAGAPVRVLVPPDDSLGHRWTEVEFDDSGWTTGRTGVGYERSAGYEDLILTDLEGSMYQQATTVYIRAPFTVADAGAIDLLTLRIKYDDGFTAYLNGTHLAERNAPAAPAWDSEAAASHPDSLALVFEEVDLSAAKDLLVPGRNVLAIHGLNAGSGSSDFLILPELTAADVAVVEIPVEEPVVVRARALDGGWSALSEAFYYFDIPLRITEIMYHPRDPPAGVSFDADDFEFVEIANTGSEPLDLAGFRLEGGVRFEFSLGGVQTLPPGRAVLVNKNVVAFVSRYGAAGLLLAGDYAGNLGNGGDRLQLVGPRGEVLLDFSYSDSWYEVTDGWGFSLVIEDAARPPERWGERGGWRPSDRLDGTPGLAEGLEPPAGGWQLPGDANQDASVDLADAVRELFLLFAAPAQAPPCAGSFESEGNLAVLDLNGDGRFSISDPVYLLGWLFRRGPLPPAGAHCRRVPGCPPLCPQ